MRGAIFAMDEGLNAIGGDCHFTNRDHMVANREELVQARASFEASLRSLAQLKKKQHRDDEAISRISRSQGEDADAEALHVLGGMWLFEWEREDYVAAFDHFGLAMVAFLRHDAKTAASELASCLHQVIRYQIILSQQPPAQRSEDAFALRSARWAMLELETRLWLREVAGEAEAKRSDPHGRLLKLRAVADSRPGFLEQHPLPNIPQASGK